MSYMHLYMYSPVLLRLFSHDLLHRFLQVDVHRYKLLLALHQGQPATPAGVNPASGEHTGDAATVGDHP